MGNNSSYFKGRNKWVEQVGWRDVEKLNHWRAILVHETLGRPVTTVHSPMERIMRALVRPEVNETCDADKVHDPISLVLNGIAFDSTTHKSRFVKFTSLT